MITQPRQASASFPPEPRSAREARRFVQGFLRDAGRPELADVVELPLSEAATNAVLHGHTEFEVVVRLAGDGSLRVEVADHNPQLPVQRSYAGAATTGRGMGLIAATADDCGVEPTAHGKVVWFVLRARDEVDDGDVDALLAAWDVDLDDHGGAEPASATVVLLGLPPTLWLAAREHHDAVLRELALHAAEHPGGTPDGARLALADQARGLVSTRVVAELRARDGGAAAPLTLDLQVVVPAGAAEWFGALQDALDTAERLAAEGRLLARAGLPEIVAVRDWACEQVISQLAGVAPSAWPGTEQERFAGPDGGGSRVRALSGWDTSVVTQSTRGAVAADDGNRILAVSAPLADSLGWSAADLVGRRVVALIPAELREAHVAGFTRHLATGESRLLGVPLQLPVLRRDGTRVVCDVLIEQAAAVGGRHVYVAWIEPSAPAAT